MTGRRNRVSNDSKELEMSFILMTDRFAESANRSVPFQPRRSSAEGTAEGRRPSDVDLSLILGSYLEIFISNSYTTIVPF